MPALKTGLGSHGHSLISLKKTKKKVNKKNTENLKSEF